MYTSAESFEAEFYEQFKVLQYFWPALSDNQSWKTFLVFLSGRLRQVLLYIVMMTEYKCKFRYDDRGSWG